MSSKKASRVNAQRGDAWSSPEGTCRRVEAALRPDLLWRPGEFRVANRRRPWALPTPLTLRTAAFTGSTPKVTTARPLLVRSGELSARLPRLLDLLESHAVVSDRLGAGRVVVPANGHKAGFFGLQ